MTIQVETNKGLIDREFLDVRDEVVETNEARMIQTVWCEKNTGEEVRRDVTVSILRSLSVIPKHQGA